MELCKSCNGGCCSRYTVSVTGDDLLRLYSSDRNVQDLVDWEAAGSFDTTYPDVRLVGGYCYMVLKRRPDGSCSLSSKKDGVVRCSVHGSHPMLCQVYPFDDSIGRVSDRRLCRLKPKPPANIMSLCKKRRDEKEQYTRKVEMWNREYKGPRRREDFIKYLIG
jgi:Fe-S-cluster containining protein